MPQWVVQIGPWAGAAFVLLLAALRVAHRFGRLEERIAQNQRQIEALEAIVRDFQRPQLPPRVEVIQLQLPVPELPAAKPEPVEVQKVLPEAQAINAANELLRAKSFDEAEEAFRGLYREHPTEIEISVPLVQILARSESKHPEALQIIERIGKVHSLPPLLKRIKVVATSSVQGSDVALELARQHTKEEPDDPEHYVPLSALYFKIGEVGRASDAAEEGLKITEDLKLRRKNSDLGLVIIKLKTNLAYFYADLWRLEYKNKARTYAEEAYAHFKNSNSTDTLGYVYITYGDTKEDIYKGIDLCREAHKIGSPRQYLERALRRATERLASMA